MTIEDTLSEWHRFSDVLMKDDRELFEKMMSDINVQALEEIELGKYPPDMIFMTLVFQQHLMINWLLKQIENLTTD